MASMLYLDYGKNDGEWVANIYGGHENLEAVEFLKHLNSTFKKRVKGAMLIAEESTAWPQITGDVKDGSLGFDYKWNMGWMNDFTGYMQYDPFFRCHHYGELTFSMLYAYSEDFILVFSHDEVVHGKASMLGKMPGDTLEVKADNLRVAYGFMYGHPGKKLLFMGQEFAQVSEWNENEELPWEIVEYPVHKTTQDYVKALNQFYKSHPALYEADYHPDGFEWINCTASQDNILVFLRKTRKADETLLFVCNFAPVEHEKFQVGVPFYGKYKEIFNSDAKEFGGSGKGNPRIKTSKKDECDERENSIVIEIPPMSMLVFSCTKADEPAKKAAGKTGTKGTAKTKKAESNSRAVQPAAGTDAPEQKPAQKADARTAAKEAAKSAAKAATEAVTKTVAKAAAKAAKTAGVKASAKADEIKGEEKKPADKEPEVKKAEDKKPEVKKLADKKPEAKKVEDKKPEVKKLADKKPEVKKVEDKKPEVKKLADKKPEVKKVEDKKPEVKKLADKKPEVKKVEDKKPEVKKLADKKPEVKKVEDKKPEAKKAEDK